MHHLSSLINSIDVVKKMSKSSDSGYLKDKTALHVGCKTTFLGTSDEYKSVKLESIYLFSSGFISSGNGNNFRYFKQEVI